MTANKKACQVLEHQTDSTQGKSIDVIIPRMLAKLSIEMEPSEVIVRDPIALAYYPLCKVKEFKLYLQAQLICLNHGLIAP